MKKQHMIIILAIIIFVVGIALFFALRQKPSYEEYTELDPTITNTADRVLLEYDKSEAILTPVDQDMSNSNKTVEEINAEYARMEESKYDSVDKIKWSYSDTNCNLDVDALTNDEYSYIMSYVLNLEVNYKDKDMSIVLPDLYNSFVFDYLSNGRNVTYKVFYDINGRSIYVYAFIK